MGQVMSQGEAPPPVVLVPPLFERDLRLRVCLSIWIVIWLVLDRQWASGVLHDACALQSD